MKATGLVKSPRRMNNPPNNSRTAAAPDSDSIATVPPFRLSIAAPDNAVKGSEITIKINVTHSANNFMHHTRWAYIKVNGKEIGRWEYPFDANDFSKEVKVKVAGPLEIEAMSNCNIHGSTGAKTKTVSVK